MRKVEEEGWELAVGWRQEEDRGIAVWMEAAGDRGAARALDTKALRADGNALIRADFGLGAQAPDVGPPGALWGGAQDRAIFLQSKVPCGLRGGTQFAMDLFCVVMVAQLFE